MSDGSLPTAIEQIGENNLQINGGERTGNNLFHSFEEFSVSTGTEAVFENAPDIENIFTRVTGEAASTIDGVLKTQGGANFFLVNPNGIVFGENAQLDVGGSFVATTAESVQFEDGSEFRTNAAEEPILTVSTPIGLQFDGNSRAITVDGSGNQITPDFSARPTEIAANNNLEGLSITSEKTLALIGGDVSIDGGRVRTSNGQIEIGAVSSGTVKFQTLSQGFSFQFNDVKEFQDIILNNRASIDVGNTGLGSLFFNSANVALEGGSIILHQNQGKQQSGNLEINASDSLKLAGISSEGNVSSVIRSEATNAGAGANLTISTNQLVLQNGGRIGATSYSDVSGGNIKINSENSVQLLENSSVNQNRQGFVVSGISTVASASGNGGNLDLTTSNLKITNGGSIQTSAARSGNSGYLTVNAETVKISGSNPNPQRTSPSALTSSVNSGNAGNFNINATELKVLDGGTIGSSTFGTGNAGDVFINIAESIEISGKGSGRSSQLNSSVISVNNPAARARLNLPEIPSGRGGNLTINTPVLNVNQEGQVSVSNVGIGNSGNLTINAKDVSLDSGGSITATSFSGLGGNIQLNAQNLQLDSPSDITATAENNGDGGKVSINTTSLLIAKKKAK